MYFRCNSQEVPADFEELITTGQIAFRSEKHLAIRSLTSVNFREEMSKSLFTQAHFKPLDLEIALV